MKLKNWIFPNRSLHLHDNFFLDNLRQKFIIHAFSWKCKWDSNRSAHFFLIAWNNCQFLFPFSNIKLVKIVRGMSFFVSLIYMLLYTKMLNVIINIYIQFTIVSIFVRNERKNFFQLKFHRPVEYYSRYLCDFIEHMWINYSKTHKAYLYTVPSGWAVMKLLCVKNKGRTRH